MADPAVSAVPALVTEGLGVRAGRRWLIRDVDLTVPVGSVTCLVGPSGVGKSTLLRTLNRLIDLTPGLAVEGRVWVEGEPVYRRGIDVDALRAKVGMLFQQPAVFPASIRDNVLFGARRVLRPARRERAALVERSLREAALWDEVADRLDRPGTELSVGQQQRLCLARALALDPAVLLMDEPTSALDPAATAAVEELVASFAGRRTVVLVTHDPAQAGRLADTVVRLATRDGAGRVAEIVQNRIGPEPTIAAEATIP
jgi:phosphate transport system ATP-binding protein